MHRRIAHIVIPRLPELSPVGKERMKAWGAAYLPLIKVLTPDPDLIPILILSLILIHPDSPGPLSSPDHFPRHWCLMESNGVLC